MLSVQLYDSSLTTSEKMPNSIIYGVCRQPEATQFSADHKSNLISHPEGTDPSLKLDRKINPCLTASGPINIQDRLFKIPYQSGQLHHCTTSCYQSSETSCWCSLRTQCDHFSHGLCLSLQAQEAIMQLPTSGLRQSPNNQ